MYSPDHMLRDLELHVQMVHVLSVQQNAPTTASRINFPNPTLLPRPELKEDATEQEWAHWKVKWDKFKRSSLIGVDETMVVDHLWACCPKELENSIWKQVGRDVDTEQELLELMKRSSKNGVKFDQAAPTVPKIKGTCRRCKMKGHGPSATEEVRKQLCPAFDKECFTCGKRGHFKQACKSKRKEGVNSSEVKTVDDGEDNTVVGNMSGTGILGKMSVETRYGRNNWWTTTCMTSHQVYGSRGNRTNIPVCWSRHRCAWKHMTRWGSSVQRRNQRAVMR